LAVFGFLYGEDMHLANNRLGSSLQLIKNVIEFDYDKNKTVGILERVSKNISEILDLMKEIRNFVDLEKPVKFNVCDCIHSELKTIPRSKLISVEKKYIISDPYVIGFKKQISQVFRVLIFNAIEAMDGEGQLTIKLEGFEQFRDKFIKATVEDTGKGISEERMKSLFILDSRGIARKAWGMGLAWSRLFLEMCGGEIYFDSEIGVGTKMIFHIPRDVRKTGKGLVQSILVRGK
jgi:signal transduction histidine kinase